MTETGQSPTAGTDPAKDSSTTSAQPEICYRKLNREKREREEREAAARQGGAAHFNRWMQEFWREETRHREQGAAELQRQQTAEEAVMRRREEQRVAREMRQRIEAQLQRENQRPEGQPQWAWINPDPREESQRGYFPVMQGVDPARPGGHNYHWFSRIPDSAGYTPSHTVRMGFDELMEEVRRKILEWHMQTPEHREPIVIVGNEVWAIIRQRLDVEPTLTYQATREPGEEWLYTIEGIRFHPSPYSLPDEIRIREFRQLAQTPTQPTP